MIIVDNITQGTDEWFEEKLGKPSSSNFSKILTSTGKRSTQRKVYMHTLAGERISGHKEETYQSESMAMGNERESQARKIYELYNSVEVEQVGLIYPDKEKKYLCSPDGLIGCKYGLEIKNVLQHTQVKRLIDNKIPAAYYPQIQGSLMITGFDRWDFFSYCPLMPELILTAKRDESYIKKIKEELEIFCEELDELVEDINGIKEEK